MVFILWCVMGSLFEVSGHVCIATLLGKVLSYNNVLAFSQAALTCPTSSCAIDLKQLPQWSAFCVPNTQPTSEDTVAQTMPLVTRYLS